MVSTLIVYYSRTGFTKSLAEGIRSKIACDIEEIQPFKGYKGFWGLVKGGFQTVTKAMPKIKENNKDPVGYDLVILGTPVWGGCMASPMRTYINNNKGKFQKVAFICTCRDSGDSAIKDLTEKVGLDPISSVVLKSEEIKSSDFSKSIEAFINELKSDTVKIRRRPEEVR